MRMWMVAPKLMCQKHLCGEHVETHMFLGALKKGTSVKGYINNNLFEPKSLQQRHDSLALEMKKRGYDHKSPLSVQNSDIEQLGNDYNVIIDREKSASDLFGRCEKCEGMCK